MRVATEVSTLLSLMDGENRLLVTCVPHPVPGQAERWFDVRFDAKAFPFAGVVTDTITETDLTWWRGLLEALAAPGEIVLGGERAAELVLAVERQVGSDDESYVVKVRLTPSADDPWPCLRWLLHNQPAFWTEAATSTARRRSTVAGPLRPNTSSILAAAVAVPSARPEVPFGVVVEGHH